MKYNLQFFGGRGAGSSSGGGSSGSSISASDIKGGKVYKTRSNGIATLGGNTSNEDVLATINGAEFQQVGVPGISESYNLGVNVKLKKAPGLVIDFQKEQSIEYRDGKYQSTFRKWDGHKVAKNTKTYNTKEQAETDVRNYLASEYKDSMVYKRKKEGK